MHVRPRALIAALACLPLGLPGIRAAVGHALLSGHTKTVRQNFATPDTIVSNTAIYVSPSGNNSNAGTTPATAKLTIQAGIDAVSAGGTVYVEPGTYTGPGNVNLDLDGSTNQFLGRDITVRSDPANNGTPANTIININSTNNDTTGFIIEQGETSASLIFGLTLENGNEDTNVGGAMQITSGSNPTVQNCVFLNNQAQLGGAIYIDDANPTIRECTFTGNAASSQIGGPPSDTNAFVGGAIEIILENNATGTYAPIVTNCLFTGNTAPSDGSAIDVSNASGAVLSPRITNCTFTGNTSTYVDAGQPGGTVGLFGASAIITNSILYGDTDKSGSNGGEITEVAGTGASVTTNYDDVQGGVTGTGDTNQDPKFAGAASGFSSPEDLASNSPEIGAGTTSVPSGVDITIDRNANPRNGRIDVGAFEAPDTPPTATAQSVALPINTATAITLTGTDPNNRTLVYSLASSPTHGTLSGTAPNLTYTPANNYAGADSFTFTVSTLSGVTSTAATVSIQVVAPPTANSQSVSVTFNTAKAITLTGSDPNSPPRSLTYIVATNPAHGTLSGTAPNLNYTPNAGYHGTDSFTFKVNNGVSDSNTATVTLTVATGTPTANAQTVSVAFNTAKPITLTGSDPDSPALALTYAIGTNPAHGTLSGFNASTGAVTYTPTSNYSGADSFTFTVNNGTNTSAPATVTLNVAPGTPTANAQSVSVPFNTATAITLTGSDPDNPPLSLTYAVGTGPAHGTLSGTAPNLTYTPTSGYHGADSFTFTVSNGTNTSSPATVSITVGVGTPTANSQSVSVAHNTAKAITLTGTDPDSPALGLTYAVATNPAHGTLSGFNASTGTVTYTPSSGYHGADSFTFTVSNGANTSAPATVTLTVAAGTPTANSQSVSTNENTATNITLTGSDDDIPALALTYTVATGPSHGTLSGTAPNLTYTPNAGYSGGDSLTFTVSNGTNTSTPATVSITVNAPTDPAPTVAVAASANPNPVTGATTNLSVLGADTAGESTLTYTWAAIGTPPAPVTFSANGTNAAKNTIATFTKPGSYTLQVTITNGAGLSTTSSVVVTVNTAPAVTTNPVNQAVNDGQGVTFTAAASGNPSPTVQWQVSTDGGSTFTNVAGATSTSLSFTATVSQSGNEYRAVFTNSVGSATTTAATLTVGSPPSVTMNPVSQTVNAGQSVTFTAAASGNPSPTVQWQVSTNGGATFTNVSGATSTSLTFTAAAGQSGNEYRAVFTNARGTATTTAATLTVNQVAATVSGTVGVSWGTAGTATLQTNADGLRLLPAGRSTDLPWLGINKISITLSQSATLSPADVSVTGINVANYGPVTISGSGSSYTLTLAQPISAADRVTLTIGNAAISTYTRRLDVLPGDVNDDGAVNSQDSSLVRNMYLGVGGANPTVFGDINGDGVVDINDYNAARQRIGTHLP